MMNSDQIKKEAADAIIDAVKYAAGLGKLSFEFGINASASLQLNIRDAMFHYKKLCDYADEDNPEKMMKQYYNLREHILRGEKDSVIMMARNVLEALSEISRKTDFLSFTSQEVKQLNVYRRGIMDIILRIRISGIDPDTPNTFPVKDFDELAQYIDAISKMCYKKNISLF